MVGRKLADIHGFKVGDVVQLRGTIFPGTWEFVVRAIYDGAEAATDTSQFLFHWDYLNETLKKTVPRRANTVGVYVVGIEQPDQAAEIGGEIDRTFRNSLAETLTETEKAFQLGFVAMTEAIVIAIRSRVLPGDLHHHGGHGEYHGHDGARALGGICHHEGARVRSGTGREPDFRRVAGHRVGRCGGRHACHLPGGGLVCRQNGHAVPGVQCSHSRL